MREALSYLTDPKVLRIWANIAYFLHFLELELGEQLHKGYGRNKELGDPDVQRALGFIFLMLKALGRSIDTSGKQLTALMEQMEKQFEMIRKQREEMGI
jgi:hypothetical protein